MTSFLYRFAKNNRLMRMPVLFALMAFSILSCQESNSGKAGAAAMKIPKDSTLFTTIIWLDSTSRDFGRIPEGRKLDVAFRFKNSGAKPLIIERVQPSCGCTVAEQPEAPIMPGGTGEIKASFNSEGRVGINHKKIYVYANTLGSQSNEVNFSVMVEKKKI